MALSHIYCKKFSFETFDVISVWLLLCYKSFKYCACQHYWSRDDTDAQRPDCLRFGCYKMVSEHMLTIGHDHWAKALDHYSLFSFLTPPLFYSLGWRMQGTSSRNWMKIHPLDATWRKSLDTWTSEYQASPGPTSPLYLKRSTGWFKFKFQEGRSWQSLSP